jgi:hypothetical protein
MKIFIKKQKYIKNPCPKLNKRVWDWFWFNFYRHRFEHMADCVEELDVIIEQALPYSNIHFYITLNGVHKSHILLPYNWYLKFLTDERTSWIDGCHYFQLYGENIDIFSDDIHNHKKFKRAPHFWSVMDMICKTVKKLPQTMGVQ